MNRDWEESFCDETLTEKCGKKSPQVRTEGSTAWRYSAPIKGAGSLAVISSGLVIPVWFLNKIAVISVYFLIKCLPFII